MYTFTNKTGQTSLKDKQERLSFLINGSLVRPGRKVRFLRPTEKVCKCLDNNQALVERDDGRLITRIEDFKAYDISRKTKNVTEHTVDGAKINQRVSYEIESVEDASDESISEENSENSADSEGSVSEEASESVSHETSQDVVGVDSVEPDTEEVDSSSNEAEHSSNETGFKDDSEDDGLLSDLKAKGVTSSEDLNLDQLEPLVKKRGEELPESFFNDDDRKGTDRILNEHYYDQS